MRVADASLPPVIAMPLACQYVTGEAARILVSMRKMPSR